MKKTITSWVSILLGCFILASGFVFFINPYNIVPGGVYGASIVLHNLFPSVQVGTFGYMFDVPLLILSVVLLGARLGTRTIVAALTTPLMMNLLSRAVYPSQEALEALDQIMGGVFGAVSFYDAVTGASAMTGALFQVSPVNTFILCVGMRVLMGVCVGLIFNGLSKLDKSRTWSYIVSAMCAPALNTLFFMGYIVLAFYNCDYVQNLVSVKGAANPLMFVVLLVGVQGVAEFLVSGILGGIVARAVHKFLK